MLGLCKNVDICMSTFVIVIAECFVGCYKEPCSLSGEDPLGIIFLVRYKVKLSETSSFGCFWTVFCFGLGGCFFFFFLRNVF